MYKNNFLIYYYMEANNKNVKPCGDCVACGNKLVPIGTARKNGKQTHGDWATRQMHKQCYKDYMDNLYFCRNNGLPLPQLKI